MNPTDERKPFAQSCHDEAVRAQVKQMLAASPPYQAAVNRLLELEREKLEWEHDLHDRLDFPKQEEIDRLRRETKTMQQRCQVIAASDHGYIVEYESENPAKRKSLKLPPSFQLRQYSTGNYYVKSKTRKGTIRLPLNTDNAEVARKIAESSHFKSLVARGLLEKIKEAAGEVSTEMAAREYFDWLHNSKKLSPSTAYDYENAVKRWLRDPKIPKNLKRVDIEDVGRFVNRPEAMRCHASTRKLQLMRLNQFFKYCIHAGYLTRNPVQMLGGIDLTGIPFDLKERTPGKGFTDEEVRRIIDDSKTSPFWRLATAIGRWTGLRMGDICQMEPANFAEPGKVVVWTDKRNSRVEVPIEPELWPFLAELPVPEDRYYWPERRLQTLSPMYRTQLSQEYWLIMRRLGMEGRSFKSLRVSYAQMLAARGESLPHIASLMGHSTPYVTAKYYVQDSQQGKD